MKNEYFYICPSCGREVEFVTYFYAYDEAWCEVCEIDICQEYPDLEFFKKEIEE